MCEVSVIAAFYNVEPYIRECVESALAQTFQDFELIAVDDGSPDACGAILDEYALTDSRMRVIHKPNGGLASARNVGIETARGKYLYFLDGDDYMMPTCLEKAVEVMRTGVGWVVFNHITLPLDHPELHGRVIEAPREYAPKPGQETLEFMCRRFATGMIRNEPWNRMFRKDVVDRYGLRFVDTWKVHGEDLCFNLMYLPHACTVRTIPDKLYAYRIRPDSLMGMAQRRMTLDKLSNLAFAVYDHYSANEDCAYLAKHFGAILYVMAHELIFRMIRDAVLHGGSYEEIREQVRSATARPDEFKRLMLEGLAERKTLGDATRPYGRFRELCERVSIPLVVSEPNLAVRIQSQLLHVAGAAARPLFKAYLKHVGGRI